MTETAPWLESRIGLLCGFVLHADAAPTPLRDGEVTEALTAGKRLWLHFNISDMRGRSFVAGMERLPERMRRDLLERKTHLRLEAGDGTLTGELSDLQIDPTDEGDVIDKLGIALCEEL